KVNPTVSQSENHYKPRKLPYNQLLKFSSRTTPYLTNPRVFLALGIIVRISVFMTLDPNPIDDHAAVIHFIVDHHRLPLSNELTQAYHPPLYYLLTAPILYTFGR